MTEGQMNADEMDAVESETRAQAEVQAPEEERELAIKSWLDREWDILGWPRTEPDDPEEKGQWMIYDDLLELLQKFDEQGHSGHSAGYISRLFQKVVMYKPLSPLTGEPSEWNTIQEKTGYVLKQNRRASGVFQESKWVCKDEMDAGTWDTIAYDNNAVVFRRFPDGPAYHMGGHRELITFPYTPKTRTIFVDENDEPIQQDAALQLLKDERKRQDEKWGTQQGEEIDIADWQLILDEEVGELAKAVLEWKHHGGDWDEIKKELIQSGAVCVKWLEHLLRQEERMR